ncbi:MAG: hypothetical protein IPM42_01760 [Saprospiraceae bacterium]|nr:hypothetical protein [Saprospiraceae bacterium]
MYIKKYYGFWMTFKWSQRPFHLGLLYAFIITTVHIFSGIDIGLPWQPISIIGIAVAFYLGFKNNSSYDRTWEARKIWGSIVNNSRTFGAGVVSFLQSENDDKIKKELIYRHIAWLKTLDYQLRLGREWEHKESRLSDFISDICSAYYKDITAAISPYISDEEVKKATSSTNIATQIMAEQSKKLQELYVKSYFNDFRHMALFELIKSFYEDQGKSERIKNFPFPRQYASTAVWLTLVFCVLVPFGMLDTFNSKGDIYTWLTVPFSALIIWIFFLMEKIGDYSENPFEGSYNDVPITTIIRGIEIDLREMIKDENIPPPLKAMHGYQL